MVAAFIMGIAWYYFFHLMIGGVHNVRRDFFRLLPYSYAAGMLSAAIHYFLTL